MDAIFRKGVLKSIQRRKTDLSLANEDELPSIPFQAFTPVGCWQKLMLLTVLRSQIPPQAGT